MSADVVIRIAKALTCCLWKACIPIWVYKLVFSWCLAREIGVLLNFTPSDSTKLSVAFDGKQNPTVGSKDWLRLHSQYCGEHLSETLLYKVTCYSLYSTKYEMDVYFSKRDKSFPMSTKTRMQLCTLPLLNNAKYGVLRPLISESQHPGSSLCTFAVIGTLILCL